MVKLKLGSINVTGLQGEKGEQKFERFCATVARWVREGHVNAICGQEHNLDPLKVLDYKRVAQVFNLHLNIGFSTSPCHRGGCFILADEQTLPHKKTRFIEPSLVCADYDFNGTNLEIASVYAPSDANQRLNFFSHIKQKLSKNTIAGGDWNCVPSVILDVHGKNALNYPNIGWKTLGNVFMDLELHDYRREQLGEKFEHTRKTTNETGAVSTRLDVWWIPTQEEYSDFLWNINKQPDLVWSEKKNSDHVPLVLTIEPIVGKRGSDRKTVRQDLLFTEPVQDKCMEITRHAYKGNKSKINKWEKAHHDMAIYLLEETKKLKKGENEVVTKSRADLRVLHQAMDAEGPDQKMRDIERELKAKIFVAQNPEAPHLASAARAKSMTDRSESCTLPFFSTYKAKSKQQWINEINKATWEEGREPIIKGTERRPQKMAGEIAKYYQMLLEEKWTDDGAKQTILRRLRLRRIQAKSAVELDRRIEDEEVRKVMDNLPLGKQAGPNRIPNAMYRTMSKFFAPRLASILRDVFEGHCEIPPHMLEGDICVLFKKKERVDIRNYRPLTMLNTDYKVYTKILANRMKKIVHEFVASMQKGFVPDVFIAECTMALTMIENWINEEPDDRQGVFIFLDMEKAFDRVSYSYLTDSMKALGFGPKFMRGVSAMYNTEAPPKRRIYANGYYSEWFNIKSGVAQGCPLSPLLFLIVAESLKISLDMQRGFKGIRIGGKYYKLSQFADDTTLMMGSIKELLHAEKGIQLWCKATGMRENKSKREGLAMGKYRQEVKKKTLPSGVDWKQEGEWARCLGVPIGNDLDYQKWWKKKIEDVRTLSRRWVGLFRTGYFGRNLVVQAMYLGRLRYWLFSLPMSKQIITMVQQDADTLWWSKEPILGEDKEAYQKFVTTDVIVDVPPTKGKKGFRRFVGKKTAIGPRSKGGLGNLDWGSHVTAFQSTWMTRYIDPSTSQWKDLMDHFILYHKDGTRKYTEGRGILFSHLTKREQCKIINSVPHTAHYTKACLRAHFEMNIELEKEQKTSTPTESLWHNHRFVLPLSRSERTYYRDTLRLKKLSDILQPGTLRVRTANQWLELIQEKGIERPKWRGHDQEHATWAMGDAPYMEQAIKRANAIHKAIATIMPGIRNHLEVEAQRTTPDRGEIRALKTPDGWVYGRYVGRNIHQHIGRDMYVMHSKDAVGKLHKTNDVRHHTDHNSHPVTWWSPNKDLSPDDDRVLGPRKRVFPQPVGWTVDEVPYRLDRYSIKLRTATLAMRKMKPPASELTWFERLPIKIPWAKIWCIKSWYTSPRDCITWLKVMHRNLFLAGNLVDEDNSCRACISKENILHLVQCKHIRKQFWDPLTAVMTDLGYDVPAAPVERDAFWLLGRLTYKTVVGPAQAGMIFLAWRCLYAAIVHSRVDNVKIDLPRAHNRTMQMTITRLRAYGEKWSLWTRINTHTGNKSVFPEKHRLRTVIKMEEDSSYHIAPRILNEYTRTKPLRKTLELPAQPPQPPKPKPSQPRTTRRPEPPTLPWYRPPPRTPTPTPPVGPTHQSFITNTFIYKSKELNTEETTTTPAPLPSHAPTQQKRPLEKPSPTKKPPRQRTMDTYMSTPGTSASTHEAGRILPPILHNTGRPEKSDTGQPPSDASQTQCDREPNRAQNPAKRRHSPKSPQAEQKRAMNRERNRSDRGCNEE